MNTENQDTAIVPAPQQHNVSLGTIQASTPAAVIAGATLAANALADMIKSRKLSVKISGREYVRAEGWQTLATILGVMPREVENVRLDDGTYLATVELVRIADGTVMSRATSECGVDEPTWAQRPNFARRSMAATRATGKACRLAFAWVMALAGYEATPAEDMEDYIDAGSSRTAPQAPPARPRTMANRDEADADAPAGAAVVPFGKNKGTPITQLSDSSLSWYHERAIKADDPNETAWLVALENEIDRRKHGQAEMPL